MDAAVLHRKISKSTLQVTKSPGSIISHPFKNKTGSKVMLTAVDGGNSEVIYGVIAAHEHVVENEIISNKVLILLEKDDENVESSCAFWSTVNAEGTLITDINADPKHSLHKSYKIDMHEYFEGSEAYAACESILLYMKNHQRSAPFSVPVDPIALQLPGKSVSLSVFAGNVANKLNAYLTLNVQTISMSLRTQWTFPPLQKI